jgi:hypothetical protein
VFGLRCEVQLLKGGARGGGGIFEEILRSSTGVGGVLATGDIRPATLPLCCSKSLLLLFYGDHGSHLFHCIEVIALNFKTHDLGDMGVEAGCSGFGLTSMRRG